MAPAPRSDEPIPGSSPAAQRLRDQIGRVAGTPLTTVLVTGECGLEPDRIARAIHARSSVAAGPFHTARCATLVTGRPGAASFDEGCPLLAQASGGTLFLEEVSALDPEAQHRLHGFLERRASGTTEPELRVVASSSEELEARVAGGRFREDLLYRLNVLAIRIPALRERPEDLPELADRVLRRIEGGLGLRCGLAPEGVEALRRHAWPGNLAELQAVLLLAAVRVGAGSIGPEHLPLGPSATSFEPIGEGASREELIPLPRGQRSLRAVEEAMIRRVLVEEAGNRSRTARVLGINRTTLYNKLRQYDIR